MKRIQTSTAVANKFGEGKAGFTNGDPVTGIPTTDLEDRWFDQMQEAIVRTEEAAGLVPSDDLDQFTTAITKLIEARVGDYALDTGAANAYVVAMNPAVGAYANGMEVRFRVVNANTAASTLNAGGGVRPLRNSVGNALAGGDLPSGSIVAATFDSTANAFLITSLVPSQTISLQNLVDNGCGQVASRGASVAFGGVTSFTIDRWGAYSGGAGRFVAQVAAPGAGFGSGIKVGRQPGDAQAGAFQIAQSIETKDSLPSAGQPVTLSFFVKKGANWAGGKLSAYLASGTGIDQNYNVGFPGATTIATAGLDLTPALTRFVLTGTMPANATQLGIMFVSEQFVGVAGADDTITITGVRLDRGAAPGNPYDLRHSSYEQGRCARFLPVIFTGQSGTTFALGQCYSAVSAAPYVPFHALARGAPTGVVVSAPGDFQISVAGGSFVPCTAVTIGNPGTNGCELIATVASGLVAGNACRVLTANANAKILFTGLEI